MMRQSLAFGLTILLWIATVVSVSGRQATARPHTNALPPDASGDLIYRRACATCHAPDGRGAPRSVVGFDAPLPDFTDCAFATAEPDPDWQAVVHEGGPIRALDRHMPAFGDALSTDQIAEVVRHLRGFCAEPAWPRGDLNFPRPFFTEKAYPENEAVLTTAFDTSGNRAIVNEVLYESRFGIRNQVEIKVPLALQEQASGQWARGLGDVAVGFKRALYANVERGRIVSAGGEVIFPTGQQQNGIGKGYAVVEPFAMFGQALGVASFVQMHAGGELPTDANRGPREAFWRSALGTTVATDRGFGRAWTPMVELLLVKEEGETTRVDVVPQLQVTLSKLQHVMISVGARVPVNERTGRPRQLLTYLLWDWADGPFLDFWK